MQPKNSEMLHHLVEQLIVRFLFADKLQITLKQPTVTYNKNKFRRGKIAKPKQVKIKPVKSERKPPGPPPVEKIISEGINHTAVLSDLYNAELEAEAMELNLAAKAFRLPQKRAHENGKSTNGDITHEIINKKKYYPTEVLFGEERAIRVPM